MFNEDSTRKGIEMMQGLGMVGTTPESIAAFLRAKSEPGMLDKRQIGPSYPHPFPPCGHVLRMHSATAAAAAPRRPSPGVPARGDGASCAEARVPTT